MIKFEILESLNYRGGNHYCYIHADEPDNLMDGIKGAWYSSGIDKHGGELFLSAFISDLNKNEIELFCGNCSVDKEGHINSLFEFPYEESEQDKWHSLGIFPDNINADSFEELLDLFFGYDSPDRVIGAYLYKVSKIYKGLSAKDKEDFGKNVLANILSFAKAHGKLQQMYQWLFSKDGETYLDSNPYLEPADKEVAKAMKQIGIDERDKFILSYKIDFGVQICVPSTL